MFFRAGEGVNKDHTQGCVGDPYHVFNNREFKIPWWRRRRKSHLKKVTFFSSKLQGDYLYSLTLLNVGELLRISKFKREISRLFTFSLKCEIWQFHVVVVQ